jgi:hypothetical protein
MRAVEARTPRRWEQVLRTLFSPRYRPGLLLAKVREDLRDLEVVGEASAALEFRTSPGEVRFTVREQLDARFLMNIVMAEFIQFVPYRVALRGSIAVTHLGPWRRTGIAFAPSRDADDELRSVSRRLMQASELHAALMPLDFTSCVVAAAQRGLEVRVQHFAACEVVGALPRWRKYIRLAGSQREFLLASLTQFQRALRVPS